MLFINAVTLVTEVGPGRKVSLKLFFMYCHVKYMKVYVKKLHANDCVITCRMDAWPNSQHRATRMCLPIIINYCQPISPALFYQNL